MKIKLTLIQRAVFLLLLATLPHLPAALAQGTAFTYQGQLQNNGSPASGTYNLTFSLYTNSSGGTVVAGPVTNNAVAISNGLFTVTIDFGADVWNGQTNWLQIGVESNGDASFTPLAPRQQVTPAPYAIYAEGANAAGISGTIPAADLGGAYSGSVNFDNGANNFDGTFTGEFYGATFVGGDFTGDFIGSGSGLTDVWHTDGNSGTTAGPDFVGTTDDQPLELHVNGLRALRLEPTAATSFASVAVNVIGGAPVNSGAGVIGGTIAGGGAQNYFGDNAPNLVADNFETIGGGVNNSIATNSYESTIAGGNHNSILTNSFRSTISGGFVNTIQNNAPQCVIAGGVNNQIFGDSRVYGYSGIVGGYDNSILTNADFSVIGGGLYNQIYGDTNDFGTGVIVGGDASTINSNSWNAFIGGGEDNAIGVGSYLAFVGGGEYNTAAGPWVFVGGGYDNTVSGEASFIGSGFYNNILEGGYSVIGGGAENEISTNSFGSVIGGGEYNLVDNEAQVATIGGGGAYGFPNHISSTLGTIAGGSGNTIQGSANDSTIGGGRQNEIDTNAWGAVIGGGHGNWIQAGLSPGGIAGNSSYATISGGYGNTIQTNANASTISGGLANTIPDGAAYAVISGGISNTASAFNATVGGGSHNQALGANSTVPGGTNDYAGGTSSLAGGNNATADYAGSFVWSDSTGTATDDTGTNQFVVRAGGGFFLYTGTGSSGAKLASGATAWSVLSDRNAKKNFKPVDTVAVLDKLAAIPIEQWNYKWEKDTDTPDIGPMAQDFKHAFYPGRDDKSITTLEFDGVELAAIQGLNEKVESGKQKAETRLEKLETENAELEKENDSLAQRLGVLEQTVQLLAHQK